MAKLPQCRGRRTACWCTTGRRWRCRRWAVSATAPATSAVVARAAATRIRGHGSSLAEGRTVFRHSLDARRGSGRRRVRRWSLLAAAVSVARTTPSVWGSFSVGARGDGPGLVRVRLSMRGSAGAGTHPAGEEEPAPTRNRSALIRKPNQKMSPKKRSHPQSLAPRYRGMPLSMNRTKAGPAGRPGCAGRAGVREVVAWDLLGSGRRGRRGASRRMCAGPQVERGRVPGGPGRSPGSFSSTRDRDGRQCRGGRCSTTDPDTPTRADRSVSPGRARRCCWSCCRSSAPGALSVPDSAAPRADRRQRAEQRDQRNGVRRDRGRPARVRPGEPARGGCSTWLSSMQ